MSLEGTTFGLISLGICFLFILFLFKVDSPFEFNDEIGPVPVDTNMEWAADATFTVSGWGTKSVKLIKNIKFLN